MIILMIILSLRQVQEVKLRLVLGMILEVVLRLQVVVRLVQMKFWKKY